MSDLPAEELVPTSKSSTINIKVGIGGNDKIDLANRSKTAKFQKLDIAKRTRTGIFLPRS